MLKAPAVPQPARAGDVVGLVLRNDRSAVRAAQPATFGQIFSTGQVPARSGLKAELNGRQVPVQLDVKATNADGSVRMGIVTLPVPALEPGATIPVMLSLAPAITGEAIDLGKLKDFDLSVDIAIKGGVSHHLDASQLLEKALTAGGSYWLRGPMVTEVRVDAPVAGSLHVSFDIRAYAGSKTVTDVAFKNDYAFQPTGGAVSYDLVIRKAGRVVFSRSNIAQPQYTQWHGQVWSAGLTAVGIVHDIAALERSGAILDYDLSAGVSPSAVAQEAAEMTGAGFGLLGNAGVTMYMGTTGGRGDIGPTTRANTIWLITQDPRAEAYAMAQADAAGSIPWHFFDPALQNYRTSSAYPKLWEDERGGTSDKGTTGLTQQLRPYSNSCHCWSPDPAHEPDLSFIPYIMTGSRYQLDQLEAEAANAVLSTWPTARHFTEAIVTSPMTQVRRQAWTLREIINAGWIAPDADPLKHYFETAKDNNLRFLRQQTLTLNEGEAAGWFPGEIEYKGTIAPWQQDYLASVIVLAAKRASPGAIDILRWQTHFLAGRFLASAHGFPPFDGIAYVTYVFGLPQYSEKTSRNWKEIELASAAAGQSGGGNAYPRGDLGYYWLGARAVLAEIVRLTGSVDAKSAYRWLGEHPFPKLAADALQVDPTWNIGVIGSNR